MKTTIDYLTFRSKAHPSEALEALRPLFGSMGSEMHLKGLPRGAMGFQQACNVCISGVPMARFDFGGESQRGWLRTSMSGKQCGWVTDWDAIEPLSKLPASEPRRLDIALTTWDGSIGHEVVVKAHKLGRFTTGGRPPDLQQITSSNLRAGQTCYVGKRTSDKFFRAYEKGLEMVSKMNERAGEITFIDGAHVDNIYRCEIELKSKDTPIAWDVIAKRDEYFAGAYPFCADVLPGVVPDYLHRKPEREAQFDLAVALENCRIQFGPTLFTALLAYHGDMTAVWDKIIGKHHCEALVEAGVLLVDHE